MIEKPDLDDICIQSRLEEEYGLTVTRLTFLPLGANLNAAVYRAAAGDGKAYFLKLLKGPFDETGVAIPRLLKAQGIQAIIAPLETRDHKLWGSLDPYTMILYPFIQGEDGYQVDLTDQQWVDFGGVLRRVHAVIVPPALRRLIPREVYSPRWREMLTTFQAQAESDRFVDPVAAKAAAFMRSKRGEISYMVQRAETLGQALQARSLEFVLCHSDVHAGNLLIAENGALYLVDWDTPIFAPKERDLLLIGGSGRWNDERKTALFYQGYGPAAVDQMALAYYRYERIIEDLAVECEQLFLSGAGGEDREQAYQFFISNFLTDHEVELARKVDTG
jgi:spectinomycin phosphotransferase